MEVEGSFTVRAPQERVWSFFLDPRALATCISDPHDLEVVDQDNFKGWVKSGVGFIKGTFTGSARVIFRKAPERARIKAHGFGMGSAFDIDSTIHLSHAGDATTVRWKADVVLSGTIASVGARLVQGTVDKKSAEFFENARKLLETE